jgi:hypothetical protein
LRNTHTSAFPDPAITWRSNPGEGLRSPGVQFGTLKLNLTAQANKSGNAATAGGRFAFDSRNRMPADVNGQAFLFFEHTQKERRKQENISDTYLSKRQDSKTGIRKAFRASNCSRWN